MCTVNIRVAGLGTLSANVVDFGATCNSLFGELGSLKLLPDWQVSMLNAASAQSQLLVYVHIQSTVDGVRKALCNCMHNLVLAARCPTLR